MLRERLRRRRLRQAAQMVPGLLDMLDATDWCALSDAYGPADRIPDHLLWLLDDRTRDDALNELYGTIWHQGTVYSSSAPAAAVLGRLATSDRVPAREHLIRLLADIATGSGYVQVHRPLMDGDEGDLEAAERREESDVRAARAAVLAGLEPLRSRLGHENDAVRRALPQLLAVCREDAEASAAKLRQRLAEETDAPARASAVLALGVLTHDPLPVEDPAGVVRLSAAVGTAQRADSPGAAGAAVQAMLAAGDGLAALAELPMWTEGEPIRFLLDAVAEFPHAQLDLITYLAGHTDPDLRRDALPYAEDLANAWRSPTPAVVDLLATRLNDEDPAVAARAAGCLRTLGPAAAPAADALYAAAKTHPDAVVALSRVGDRRAVDLLASELARDPPGRWTGEALKALGPVSVAVRDRVLELIPTLREPHVDAGGVDNRLPQYATWLGTLGADGAPAVPVLTRLLSERRGMHAAVTALGALGPLAGAARTELEDLLTSDDDLLRAQAAAALARVLGDPAPAIEEASRLLQQPQRGALKEVLEALDARAATLEPALKGVLDYSDEWVRLPAAQALWRVTGAWHRPAEVLRDLAGPTPVGERALALLAEMPRAATASLRPRLERWRDADRRPIAWGTADEVVQRDDRLRGLCERLLT